MCNCYASATWFASDTAHFFVFVYIYIYIYIYIHIYIYIYIYIDINKIYRGKKAAQ